MRRADCNFMRNDDAQAEKKFSTFQTFHLAPDRRNRRMNNIYEIKPHTQIKCSTLCDVVFGGCGVLVVLCLVDFF